MKSRKEEHPDECNYETVKKETRNEKFVKFGGTSVGTVERMKHVATLIKDATPKNCGTVCHRRHHQTIWRDCANLFNREIEQAHDRITGWNSSSSNLPMGC